jgi:hypothetical protein
MEASEFFAHGSIMKCSITRCAKLGLLSPAFVREDSLDVKPSKVSRPFQVHARVLGIM